MHKVKDFQIEMDEYKEKMIGIKSEVLEVN